MTLLVAPRELPAADASRARRLRLASALLWATVAWNTLEGIIAVTAGVLAGSVALVGFGLDSAIEVGAAGVLIWRLRAPDTDPTESRERLARRLIGASFFVLAAYILAQSAYVVLAGHEPETSGLGLALAITSLILMPAVGLAKRRNARKLHSHALIAESTETLVCSYLSLTLFVGLGANAAFGWWWADIAAALAMVPWILKEGLEGLRGDPCGEDCA
jgi:divalent metal cation (Fe/Co/Zn/Cd) transporter